MPQNIKIFRLNPGEDLKRSLVEFITREEIQAAVVLTCVGSLKVACLRFAGAQKSNPLDGPFEILSLSGTLSKAGVHLHMAVSDGDGKTVGGHLLDGSLIYTTAEIAILILENYRFERELDEKTGFKELKVFED